MKRGADVPIVVGEKRWLLGELPEVGVAPAGVDANIGEIAGDYGKSHLTRKARLIDGAGEPYIVDPHLQRVSWDDRVRSWRCGKANHAYRQLLYSREIGRTYAGVDGVDDVTAVAGRVAGRGGRSGR